MNSDKNIENEVQQTLDVLSTIKKVEAPDNTSEKLLLTIHQHQQQQVKIRWAIAATFALFLINSSLFYLQFSSSEISAPLSKQEQLKSFAKEYQLTSDETY